MVLTIIGATVLATFLRLLYFNQSLTLTAEIGQHFLEIIRLLQGHWLLQGPLTSHPWLRLSATPYYLFFPIFALFRFHPLTLTYLWTAIGILIIPLNYFVIKKVFDSRAAAISTTLISISPIFLEFNKLPGFFDFVIPLSYLFLVSIHSNIDEKKGAVWPVFLIVSFMGTLHAASFMLLPFFLAVFFILKKFSKKQIVASTIAFVIPQIPFLINDYFDGFSMTKNFLLWIPYKFVNFATGKTLGLASRPVADQTMVDIFNFLKLNFFPSVFPWFFSLMILVLIAWYLIKGRPSLFMKIIVCWLIFGLFVLTIHKNPPIHYFVPILILPTIIVSVILSKLKNGFLIPILVFLATINIFFAVVGQKTATNFISYDEELRICKSIIKDAAGKKYTLSRRGPFDNYQDQFKENYEYLLWWLGNRPVENAKLNYSIVENSKGTFVYRGKILLEK